MNFGLVGWGNTSGNGGMNSDIARLSPWVTHWLVPDHPKSPIHQPYLNLAKTNTEIVHCNLDKKSSSIVTNFLDKVDGIIYVEHPCLKDDINIVIEAKKKNKIVIGIPMWEWWPLHKNWALETDMLWSVTDFTYTYLKSLANVLSVQGYMPKWRNRIIGNRWGVNLSDFSFKPKTRANKFVFVNGNGGYNLRKASDIVFKAFSKEGAPPLLVYTQQMDRLATPLTDNIELVHKNFPDRNSVYEDGDVFLFPSYWEGLCHGIYEAQACGGVVVTSEQPPMNQCGSNHLIRVESFTQENLAGNKIIKAIPSADHLFEVCQGLYRKDISLESKMGRINIEKNFDLSDTLNMLYASILSKFEKE